MDVNNSTLAASLTNPNQTSQFGTITNKSAALDTNAMNEKESAASHMEANKTVTLATKAYGTTAWVNNANETTVSPTNAHELTDLVTYVNQYTFGGGNSPLASLRKSPLFAFATIAIANEVMSGTLSPLRNGTSSLSQSANPATYSAGLTEVGCWCVILETDTCLID